MNGELRTTRQLAGAIDMPLHCEVETVAARTPDALAVVDHDGTRLSYRELDTAANRLAHRLRRHGAGPGVPVGVCLHRGADLVTSLLATWKAGGAYLPLDPELPALRITDMLAGAAPPVVVTHAALAAGFPTRATFPTAAAFPAVVVLDADRDALAAEPGTAPGGGAGPDDPAYVLHPSDSTGAPQGVQVGHRGVHDRIAWTQDTYRLEPADRVLQQAPCGSDVSVWESIWPLVTGATVVVAAPGGHRDPRYLHELVTRAGVTTLHLAPTMLRAFLDATQGRGLGQVRRVFTSGEALPADIATRFLTTWPHIELRDLSGPARAAIDVTVPSGRSFAGTH